MGSGNRHLWVYCNVLLEYRVATKFELVLNMRKNIILTLDVTDE